MPKPPTSVDLIWIGDLRFDGKSDKASMTLDSSGVAGPSPVQALGFAIAGCMTTDVVHILTKGRHPLKALRSHLVAERAQDDPHRFLKMTLRFTVEGKPLAIEQTLSLMQDASEKKRRSASDANSAAVHGSNRE